MSTQDAASIAASIDVSTTAGWNLRALLLRMADGQDWRAVPWGSAAWARQRGTRQPDNEALLLADDMGLAIGRDPAPEHLTPLGREVAERMRPKPWTTKPGGYGGEMLVDPEGFTKVVHPGIALAMRCADLLTRDDLDKAKTYRAPE
jgi:hypothetical protein